MPALIGSRRALFYNTPAVVTAGKTLTALGQATGYGGANSTVSITSVDIGTAASDRCILVAAFEGNAAYTSVAIGGDNFTPIVSVPNGPDVLKIYTLQGTLGGSGTATITATSTGNFHQRAIWAWVMTGLTSTAAQATNTSYASPANISLTVAPGDYVFVCGVYPSTTGAWTVQTGGGETEGPTGGASNVPWITNTGSGTNMFATVYNNILTTGTFTTRNANAFTDICAASFR
jgi:hypothetical protein